MNRVRPTRRSRWINLEGRWYRVQVFQSVWQPVDAPRLLIISHLLNEQAFDILRVCVQAIQKFTAEPHEIWIIDNNSPKAYARRLLEFENVNIVLNHTEPRPRGARGFQRNPQQMTWGSYANAIGLELGIRLIDPSTRYVMTLHMDTMPCHPGWLSYLRGKISQNVRAAGVRLDTVRVADGILHVLCYLIDFQLFRQLNLNFYPQLPDFDVGDLAIVGLRESGYDIFACPNTLWQPELVDTLPADSPFRRLYMDRAFDDQGNVIFLHLGRGVRKSIGNHTTGTLVDDWLQFARDMILQ